jgi:hypothetical protein
MAGSLIEDSHFTNPVIKITKKDFKMPEINMEYISGMSKFLDQSVDEFSDSCIQADVDLDASIDSIQTNDEDGYEQIMINKGTFMRREQQSQPNFHQEGRTFCQKMFPYLASSTDLNSEELHAYHTIKA